MIKKLTIFILIIFVFFIKTNFAQTPVEQQKNNSPRYAVCDLCGFCPPSPPPQNWLKCKQCLYPDLNDDPTLMESLKIDTKTNLPPSPKPGRQYTFFGCLGNSNSFTEEGAAGGLIQSILNIIFSITGGIAFIYFLYGSFIIVTSQSDPEKLNYGKRVITGSIIGLIFTLGSIFIVNFIASGVLKLPGFGGQ
ncbi:MAG: hypothetical protein KatS3mg092_0376 [Patescibacteria group bacterium]|nr:MAG: hypothetical protein KatS3mg092_0376 [Patescibacteria group bacterium]